MRLPLSLYLRKEPNAEDLLTKILQVNSVYGNEGIKKGPTDSAEPLVPSFAAPVSALIWTKPKLVFE